MAEEIIDGTGQGYSAKVNSLNQLETNSVTQSVGHFSNVENGEAWHLVFERAATGTTNPFFYFENTGTEEYILEGFTYRVASAESLLIYLNDTGTTPAGGTDITPVNCNTSSSKVMTVVAKHGGSITGLTAGDLVEQLYLTSTESSNYNFDQDIVIAPGGRLSFRVGTGSVQLSLTLYMYKNPGL